MSPPAPLPWRQLRLSNRLTVVGVLLLLTLLGLELGARGYWCARHHVPFTHPDLAWKTFFPEWDLSGVEEVPAEPGEVCHVLLLGGSVLSGVFGDVGPRLQKGLQARLRRPVRVINLAFPGRTTRDSRLKYERLGGHHFDLVLVYDAINDVHLNNCPPGTFRSDYTHAARFAQLAALERHRELPYLAFPFTCHYLASSLLDRLYLDNGPRRAWNHYGSDLRSPPSYEANMERIVELAQQRRQPVLLLTFAYHIAPGYSEEAFAARELDYALHMSEIALWGEPANVARALDAHNAVTARLARRHRCPFLDVKGRMPTGRRYFHDVCHFTPEGAGRFVDLILAGLDVERLVRSARR
jgi:hypothetical protein